MAKPQMLSEVTGVLAIERGSIVDAYRHWYVLRGEGEKFYFDIFAGLTGHGCHAQRLSLIWHGYSSAACVPSPFCPTLGTTLWCALSSF